MGGKDGRGVGVGGVGRGVMGQGMKFYWNTESVKGI